MTAQPIDDELLPGMKDRWDFKHPQPCERTTLKGGRCRQEACQFRFGMFLCYIHLKAMIAEMDAREESS